MGDRKFSIKDVEEKREMEVTLKQENKKGGEFFTIVV